MNKVKIIIFNIFSLFIIFVIVFFVYKAINLNAVNKKIETTTYSEKCKFYEKDELKPFKLYPQTPCEGEVFDNGKIVKKIKITIDNNGFRKTPDNYDPKKPAIVVMGCSFAFGYRLED